MKLGFLSAIILFCLPGKYFTSTVHRTAQHYVVTDTIAVKFLYADSSLTGLNAGEYFFELLKTECKKRGDKQNREFILQQNESKQGHTSRLLSVEFSHFVIGEIKSEQSSRIASVTVSKTTHDKEIMEHKVGSVNARTEIIRVKKSLPCNLSAKIELFNTANSSAIYANTFFSNYNWTNEFIRFEGGEELLTREEKKLAKAGEQPPSAAKQLIRKNLEQLIAEISPALNRAFSEKKGF